MAYHTSATTKGGRNGRAELDSHGLALAMALPKDLGGAGDGHNPEQLFAIGYSACFGQAILALNTDAGFSLSVELKVSVPGADKAKVQALMEEAHTICPYSKATKGNIPVKLTVV
jgi:organic hydroperoxide reductase OsmC/OhrA